MHRYINGNVHGKSEFDRWFLFLGKASMSQANMGDGYYRLRLDSSFMHS